MSEKTGQAFENDVRVILAGRSERFDQFRKKLEGLVNQLCLEESGQAVMERISEGITQIVVVDDELSDMDGSTLVKDIAKLHPFVNTALVSTLTEHDFHEETEGLGVLMQLPSPPDAESAEKLLAHYRSIWG